ncbi:uncharacterized protein LOC127738668 [Mytilus californianus]|uniref:uncharacterized protein LOC127738668 n=1 Tax=Mytilus californianus TaxID=6549 RepID=UPI0022450AE3|nr:uncharacterized protein LOC127738668 [Mytilus californianus]
MGKRLEDVSKDLLKKSTKGLTHISKQIATGIKDTLKGLKKTTRPLIKGTVKILNTVGKTAGKAVKDLGKGISKTLSNTAKLVGGAVRRILNTRLPRISYRLPRVRLPRVSFRAPRIHVRLPRVSFRGPRFGRRWGKKRDTKIVRDMSCSCTMCDPFEEGVSETEMTKRVCGSSYFSNQANLDSEFNDLSNLHDFTVNNQLVTKIVMELSSLEKINSEYYLSDSKITFLAPNGRELNVEMTKGMPFAGLTPLNTTEIASIEGPKVFKLLKMNP